MKEFVGEKVACLWPSPPTKESHSSETSQTGKLLLSEGKKGKAASGPALKRGESLFKRQFTSVMRLASESLFFQAVTVRGQGTETLRNFSRFGSGCPDKWA